jgi:hypothetical protein
MFLRQRSISARNILHIQMLTQYAEPEVGELAEIVLAIARVKPGRRRRMQIIAREHPDLFIDMVAVLDEEFWDDFFYRFGGNEPDWLRRRWHEAKFQVRFHAQGKTPCWCGSGQAYRNCCAERDDAYAEVVAAEEEDRKWRESLEPIP